MIQQVLSHKRLSEEPNDHWIDLVHSASSSMAAQAIDIITTQWQLLIALSIIVSDIYVIYLQRIYCERLFLCIKCFSNEWSFRILLCLLYHLMSPEPSRFLWIAVFALDNFIRDGERERESILQCPVPCYSWSFSFFCFSSYDLNYASALLQYLEETTYLLDI